MDVSDQTDQLNFNMDRDRNINQINNTEATEPVKKVRGRPKKTIQNHKR